MKKFVQGFAAFEVVKERLNGNAGTEKDRRASQNFWVAVDDSLTVHTFVASLYNIPQPINHSRIGCLTVGISRGALFAPAAACRC